MKIVEILIHSNSLKISVDFYKKSAHKLHAIMRYDSY